MRGSLWILLRRWLPPVWATLVASDNEDKVVPAEQTFAGGASTLPIQFNLPNVSLEGWMTVGADVTKTNDNSVWTCPHRPDYPLYSAANNQYVIGYQYCGGIWRRRWNSGPRRRQAPITGTFVAAFECFDPLVPYLERRCHGFP
jgi:hypothetical protein